MTAFRKNSEKSGLLVFYMNHFPSWLWLNMLSCTPFLEHWNYSFEDSSDGIAETQFRKTKTDVQIIAKRGVCLMKSLESKRNRSEIPLCVLGVLCFITSVMSQTRFTLSQKPSPDNMFNHNHEGKWFIWNTNKPDFFGFFLKAVIVATTPFHSFASTCLLLFGINKKNLYLFLPWLLLTLKGFLIIQTFNWLELLRLFLEKRISLAMDGEWKMLTLALVIIVFDAAEYICFNEVFRMFKILWANSSQDCEEPETEEKSITEEVGMEVCSDDKDR